MRSRWPTAYCGIECGQRRTTVSEASGKEPRTRPSCKRARSTSFSSVSPSSASAGVAAEKGPQQHCPFRGPCRKTSDAQKCRPATGATARFAVERLGNHKTEPARDAHARCLRRVRRQRPRRWRRWPSGVASRPCGRHFRADAEVIESRGAVWPTPPSQNNLLHSSVSSFQLSRPFSIRRLPSCKRKASGRNLETMRSIRVSSPPVRLVKMA